MWQFLPPATLLLLVSADKQTAEPSKAVVVLDPPWDRILEMDQVTFTCKGTPGPGNNDIKWLLNGSLISNQSTYVIKEASVGNSGEYQCQTNLSALSDPIRLDVHQGWLLLQASRWVAQVGDAIQLRCHSWKQKHVIRVNYFLNGRSLTYFPRNSDFYIASATLKHNGSYSCRGIIGKKNVSSTDAWILVQGPPSTSASNSFLSWSQIIFYLLMGLVFMVDTGLYLSVSRELQSSMGLKKNIKVVEATRTPS